MNHNKKANLGEPHGMNVYTGLASHGSAGRGWDEGRGIPQSDKGLQPQPPHLPGKSKV